MAENLQTQFAGFANQNFISCDIQGNKKQRILKERSAFRKFTRKIQTRLKKAKIDTEIQNPQNFQLSFENSQNILKPISSKTWKTFAGIEKRNDSSPGSFSKNYTNSSIFKNSEENFYFQRFYKKLFTDGTNTNFSEKSKTHLSKKDRFLQRYKNFLMNSNSLSFDNKAADSICFYTILRILLSLLLVFRCLSKIVYNFL